MLSVFKHLFMFPEGSLQQGFIGLVSVTAVEKQVSLGCSVLEPDIIAG